jgi:hypothetical protein
MMETDPRSHVRPGDKLRIAAEQINWINRQMAADTSFGGGPLAGVEPGKNVILARNNTGGDVPRWGVMAIGGVEINPTAGDTQRRSFEEQPCITGTMPSATTGAAFCIAVEPIKAGKIGRVAVAGVVQAKLTVGSGVTGDRARPHASRDTLELAANGPARVLWRPSGSGTVWGLVRIDECDPILIGRYLGGENWNQFECNTVTLFRSPTFQQCLPVPVQPLVEIERVRNITHKVIRPDSWVVIGKAHDGYWYVIESEPERLRVGKYQGSLPWIKGACADVTIWESGFGCETEQSSPTETVMAVRNATRGIVLPGTWVTIERSQNGYHYLVDAESGLRIGKTSSTWTKGTLANITLWEGGTPQAPAVGGGTINNVANLWGDVPANKWVGITDALRGAYYLVVAEC